MATDATSVTVNGEQKYIRNLSTDRAVVYHAMKSKTIDEMKGVRFLEKYSHNHLLFLQDFAVPFDDNISERDLRKAKNRQKWRAVSGKTADMKCTVRF